MIHYQTDQQIEDIPENNDFFKRQILDADLVLGHQWKNNLWLISRIGFILNNSTTERFFTDSQVL